MTAAIQDYYSDQDFEVTDAILARAAQCKLTGVQRRLVDRLILANRHNRLTFETMRAVALADSVAALEKAAQLVDFRIQHKDNLHMNWPNLFRQQAEVCGVDARSLAATCKSLTSGGRKLTDIIQSARNLVDNGGFENGLAGWDRSRWHADSAQAAAPYEKEAETFISDTGALEGAKCVVARVKPEHREYVYSISRTVPVAAGTSYLFRFGWKRKTEGELLNVKSLENPRFRLSFRDASGEPVNYGVTRSPYLWGKVGNQRPDTDWTRLSRIIQIAPDSPIGSVNVTIFFSSWSQNLIDDIEWRELKANPIRTDSNAPPNSHNMKTKRTLMANWRALPSAVALALALPWRAAAVDLSKPGDLIHVHDEGATWNEELILRPGGGDEDIGTTRNALRPDGKIVTIYYGQEDEKAECDIAATIWTPPARSKNRAGQEDAAESPVAAPKTDASLQNVIGARGHHGTAPHLNTWLVAGPFAAATARDAATMAARAGAGPRAGQHLRDRPWELFDDRLFSRNYDDYQDLYSYFKIVRKAPVTDQVALAHLNVWCPTARTGQLRVGFNDGLAAWVNGEPAADFAGPQGAARDAEIIPVKLTAGWNRLLLAIGNRAGAWGFYARLCDDQGNEIPGWTPSPGGPSGELRVATSALPKGYSEWPYVWLQLKEVHSPNDARASEFRFLADGGSPPYRWALTRGRLPPDLHLDADRGALDGICLRAGEFTFTLEVTDAAGQRAKRDLTLRIEDRPTRRFEEARLLGFLHGTDYEKFAPNRDPVFRAAFARQMKGLGLGYIVPKSHRHAELWVPDLRQAGLQVGLYYSLYGDTSDRPYANDRYFAEVERLMEDYSPASLWFDEFSRHERGWEGGRGWETKRFEFDALFSMIRTHNPATAIINNNGRCDLYRRGDIDLVEAEGWGEKGDWYWCKWPDPAISAHSPKRMPIESWRNPGQGRLDPNEWLRVIFSLVGEGHIANLDLSPTTPADAFREALVRWLAPRDGVHLIESLRGTTPLPLSSADWGYAVARGSTVYLYILKNRRGKSGVPPGESLTASPLPGKVLTATQLNTGKAVRFEQTGDRVVLRAADLVPDSALIVVRLDGGALPDSREGTRRQRA